MATNAPDPSSTTAAGFAPGDALLARNRGWLALRGGLLALLVMAFRRRRHGGLCTR